MSEHYPRVRLHARNGALILRDGLTLCFYMRHSHQEIAKVVMRSLEVYLHAVGPDALSWFCDMEGEWQELDSHGREAHLQQLSEEPVAHLVWRDEPGVIGELGMEYWGRDLENASGPDDSGLVSRASFWLPTEFLEKHGPGRVRELALELATPLPFTSGYAGLAFNAVSGFAGFDAKTRALCFRYPGMDVHDNFVDADIGPRVRGVSWLTFLGQPVLGALGGTTGLRARLGSPGTTVQEMEHERAVITLGPWPEAGDTEQGKLLPGYRELARVLEPWLYHHPPRRPAFLAEEQRRWERRFLD